MRTYFGILSKYPLKYIGDIIIIKILYFVNLAEHTCWSLNLVGNF